MTYHRTYQIGALDRVAYQVLAVSYTGIYVDLPNVQRYIGQPCVAVAYCQGTMYIAANNLWRSLGPGPWPHAEIGANVGNQNVFALIVHELRAEGVPSPIRLLQNPAGENDTAYHAELQLIDFVYDHLGGAFDGNLIGVSKPCCQTCANELLDLGVGLTDFHALPSNAQRPGPGVLPVVAYAG
jgi:hypothetical protein